MCSMVISFNSSSRAKPTRPVLEPAKVEMSEQPSIEQFYDSLRTVLDTAILSVSLGG